MTIYKSNNNTPSHRGEGWGGILLAIAIIILASCNSQTGNNEIQHERDSLRTVIAEKENELNDFMGVFAEIQESLRQMNEAEGRVTVAEADPERVNKVEQIREDMTFLNEAMQQQRERISKLQERLQASSLNVKQMQKAIENLQAQLDVQTARVQELKIKLAKRDELIALQNETINKQDEAINKLGEENEQKSKTVAEQTKQLNEAWYVFGTKSELKAQKIIDKGEVLTTGNFNKDYFTQIDIREMKEIKLYSKNAKLLTSHPQGSYTLATDAKGEYVLKIGNAQKFWSLSRYLVIQVK